MKKATETVTVHLYDCGVNPVCAIRVVTGKDGLPGSIRFEGRLYSEDGKPREEDDGTPIYHELDIGVTYEAHESAYIREIRRVQ